MSKIHVIGDSHVRAFENIKGCIIYWLGPKTMYGIRKGLNVKSLGVNENDFVLYIFGEIDVRTHIGRIRDLKSKNIDIIIDDLVDNYIKIILENQGNTKSHSIIGSIVPPSELIINKDYPFYGTIEDRVNIQKKLNNRLKEKCDANNIMFLDYIKDFTLENGSLNHKYSDGHVHILSKYIPSDILDSFVK